MPCFCRHSADAELIYFSSYVYAQDQSKALYISSFLYVKLHFSGKFSRARVLWSGLKLVGQEVV